MRATSMVRSVVVTLVGLATLFYGFGQPWSAQAQSSSCVPQVRTTTSTLEKSRSEVTAMTVALQATATVSGGDQIVSVTFASATNGVVEIGGSGYSVPGTYTLPAPSGTWSFVLRKVTL